MQVTFHPLARAIIIAEGKILLAHAKGQENIFLPGGHIESGEPTVYALKRELYEETGLNCDVGEYVGAVESEWKDARGAHHEINHIFLCGLTSQNSHSPVSSREDHLEFIWADIADLEKYNLLPEPLTEIVKSRSWNESKSIWASTFEK